MRESFWNDMIAGGVEPYLATYDVLSNGICRRARLHPDVRVERMLRAADKVCEMRDKGIEPDRTSHSIVTHVYGRVHKPQLLLDKMKMTKEMGISLSLRHILLS